MIGRAQLLRGGLGAGAIDYRVRGGELSVIHRGVYLVAGAELTMPAREIAAVLACGESAFLSHRSAAYRLGLLPYPAHSPTLEVTVSSRSSHPAGILVHRSRGLPPGDSFILDHLPLTTPRRTLLDLAAVAPGRPLERAVATALTTNRVGRAGMLAYLERHRHRHGVRVVRRLLEPGAHPADTHSEAEELLLALIRAAELPEPRVNVRLDRFEVDFLWERERLVVEMDGWRYHGDRAAIERDRARDARLAALGYRTLRIGWRQLDREPDAVVRLIALALP